MAKEGAKLVFAVYLGLLISPLWTGVFAPQEFIVVATAIVIVSVALLAMLKFGH